MGILEWSSSARDPLIYFAMCLSIPSMALYIAQIVTILRHKQFRNSFYSLFIIRAIPDLLYVLNSFYGYRLPILFGSVLYPVYSLLPNWILCLDFFLTGYTFQANNLATAFILLNRLTAISLPLMHEKLWRKFLPLVAIVVFCVPICSYWVMFKIEGVLQIEKPNSADQSFLLYEAGEAPFLNYLNYIDAATSVIFMSVCSLINIVALTAYKWHTNNVLNPASSDQLERKLFIYALATFSGHALIACLFIGSYIATNSQNMPMAMAMYAHYPWVMDTGSVVIPSWLLLWAGESFRQQLLKDYLKRTTRSSSRAPTETGTTLPNSDTTPPNSETTEQATLPKKLKIANSATKPTQKKVLEPAAKRQLQYAIDSITKVVKTNNETDLLEYARAFTKIQPSTDPEVIEDFLDNFAPETNPKVLDALDEVQTKENELFEAALKHHRTELSQKTRVLDARSLSVQTAVEKARRASVYNQRLIKQIQTIIETPSRVQTRSGLESLKIHFQSLQANYVHFDRFVFGLDRTVKAIRKLFDLSPTTDSAIVNPPNLEENHPSTSEQI
ncbi:hypothetical protein GPALN_006941 [Globodera pallida]|nr:hypothetical protein GPALN_006941 [Globodera pallida]